MHAKYQVFICNGSKVMANVKVVLKQTIVTNNVTNKQTNKQTGQKQYVPQILSGGHKNWNPITGLGEEDFFKIWYLVAMATRGITLARTF